MIPSHIMFVIFININLYARYAIIQRGLLASLMSIWRCARVALLREYFVGIIEPVFFKSAIIRSMVATDGGYSFSITS